MFPKSEKGSDLFQDFMVLYKGDFLYFVELCWGMLSLFFVEFLVQNFGLYLLNLLFMVFVVLPESDLCAKTAS